MAQLRNPLKGLFKVKAKGKVYYYAFRGGPRIEAKFGTNAFLQEFIDARAPANTDKARIGAWVTIYKSSDDYTKLADSTKRNWGPLLDNIKQHFGEYRVRFFNRPDIRQDIKQWRNRWRTTPRMADLAKQVLSRVCSFMVEEGVLATNPCEGISNLYSANRADIIWTDDDLEALQAAASPEIYNAAQLAACTGLRQGDLLRLTWTQVKDTCIEIKTSKSRGRRFATIPMTKGLRAVLATVPRRALTVLTNTQGEPWRGGFRSSWEKAMGRAGLGDRDLHFHDLRGTAATKFTAAGLEDRTIASIMGWSLKRVQELLDRYVRHAEVIRLSAARIESLERFQNENNKTDSKTGDRQ